MMVQLGFKIRKRVLVVAAREVLGGYRGCSTGFLGMGKNWGGGDGEGVESGTGCRVCRGAHCSRGRGRRRDKCRVPTRTEL
jgi:hypothetical protein